MPELFVKLNGRSFKFGKFKEHTADGNRLGIHPLTLGCKAFVLFLLGAEAVGEVIVVKYVNFLSLPHTVILKTALLLWKPSCPPLKW